MCVSCIRIFSSFARRSCVAEKYQQDSPLPWVSFHNEKTSPRRTRPGKASTVLVCPDLLALVMQSVSDQVQVRRPQVAHESDEDNGEGGGEEEQSLDVCQFVGLRVRQSINFGLLLFAALTIHDGVHIVESFMIWFIQH